MKKKKLLALIGSVCLILVLASLPFMGACAKPAPAPAPTPAPAPAPTPAPEVAMRVGGSAIGSTNYYLAGATMKIINAYVPGIKATAEATGGSVEISRLVGTGEMLCGFAGLDFALPALYGTEPFEEQYDLAIMVWAPTFDSYWLTLDPEINSIQELRGKKVAIGDTGSGTAATNLMILPELGITEKDFTPVWLGEMPGMDALRDGTVQAVGIMASRCQTAILQICAMEKVHFIHYSPEEIDTLLANHPTWAKTIVPAGNYEGLDEDYDTIGVVNLLVCYSKAHEDTIYTITKAIWEHTDVIKEAHPIGEFFDIKHNARVVGMPMHPGAVKYYKEVGVIK